MRKTAICDLRNSPRRAGTAIPDGWSPQSFAVGGSCGVLSTGRVLETSQPFQNAWFLGTQENGWVDGPCPQDSGVLLHPRLIFAAKRECRRGPRTASLLPLRVRGQAIHATGSIFLRQLRPMPTKLRCVLPTHGLFVRYGTIIEIPISHDSERDDASQLCSLPPVRTKLDHTCRDYFGSASGIAFDRVLVWEKTPPISSPTLCSAAV
jgi:hypothetical protein